MTKYQPPLSPIISKREITRSTRLTRKVADDLVETSRRLNVTVASLMESMIVHCLGELKTKGTATTKSRGRKK